MGTLLNVILVVEKTYQYFISLKLIQNYALFLPFHNETQNNSNIGKKKKNSNKQSDTFAKGKQNCAGN